MLVLCEAKGIWEGIQGTPEVRYRSTSLQFTTQPWRLALSDNEPWLDLHPHPSRAGVWYFLMASGAMAMAESRSPIIRVLHQPPDLGFAADAETSFCVSPCGRFAAIFEASGPNACVLEIQSGRVTMRVSRGDYHPENSCFPIVFFIHDGRTLLVAATDWNRLDVFDPNDGRILTNRAPTTYSNGEVRPS
ncbi:MAG TPA: hypothetical protein VHM90_11275, partial [Phycisphaerae bacterium]|nr:hypothetical protein [Phycisphaerae bacterium]